MHMDNTSNYSGYTNKTDTRQYIANMSDEDKRLFYCLSHKAQHALIHSTWGGDTESIFTGLNGSTCEKEQKGSTLLEALASDAAKRQLSIVPQETQPISGKCPSNKPVEPRSKKPVVVKMQETISEQVFNMSPSLVVGNSGVTLSSQPIRLASADLFGNTQEPLYHQHQIGKVGFSFLGFFCWGGYYPSVLISCYAGLILS
ncbi:hypothetical protein DSO57_1022994 [Entomophthora muscae]|uniref:Uncharacterized protein n=1 Tax=Entomophthora muscae TaxID=34485 RepID=A0ACC2U1D0_9FUNG|nr:hypothetical protein DSO57_1022994 [Entomophthora muscae]